MSADTATNPGSPSGDRSEEPLWRALLGDGRSLLSLTGIALILSGGFMLFLSATGSFLPHDIDYLGMNAAALCDLAQCRVVHFMFHDRVSFGGVLIAIGTLYLWLAEFPLRRGEEWAWWVFAASGLTGFASFLSYLGYGYLDTWHGAATLALFPLYLIGLWRTRSLLPSQPRLGWRSLRSPSRPLELRTRLGKGRTLLLFAGLGMTLAGTVITIVGMTSVFVPEDLAYMGLSAAQIGEISPRLLPLIAHDRAGFGGGLLSCGVTVFLIVWKAPLTRALWQALLLSGIAGFACAIGIHYHIGYLIFTHLAPAWVGALLYAAGMAFLWRQWPQTR